MSTEALVPLSVDAYIVDPEVIKIHQVEQIMREHITRDQMHELRDALETVFLETSVGADKGNDYYLNLFIEAKTVENCSKRTLTYYRDSIKMALDYIGKPIRNIDANDIRRVLAWYMIERKCSPVTANNVRRNLSSFFQWLENEDYVRKSPVKRTKAVRTEKADKQPFSDMDIAKLRDSCNNVRNRAIFEMLLSSGMRIGELVGLDRNTVDLSGRECEVLGKGNKRRMCYFSADAAMYIDRYLKTRTDTNQALFVAKSSPHNRLSIGSVESMIRKLGKAADVPDTHPHRFRRTFATNNLRHGMKVEEIQQLLGHENIDTTMIYAKVDKELLKTKARRLA